MATSFERFEVNVHPEQVGNQVKVSRGRRPQSDGHDCSGFLWSQSQTRTLRSWKRLYKRPSNVKIVVSGVESVQPVREESLLFDVEFDALLFC